MTTTYVDRDGRRHTPIGPRRVAARLPARRAAPLRQKEGETVPANTPNPTDVADRMRLHERAKQLQLADPRLEYPRAVMRASEQLARGEPVADPDRTLLHAMAQRWCVEHRSNNIKAGLLAVSAEWEALLEAGKRPKRPSDRIASVKTAPAEDPSVRAYADANTITYDAALLALAKLGLEAEPTELAAGVLAVQIPTPTPAQIRAHAKARGIKASAALVELMAESERR